MRRTFLPTPFLALGFPPPPPPPPRLALVVFIIMLRLLVLVLVPLLLFVLLRLSLPPPFRRLNSLVLLLPRTGRAPVTKPVPAAELRKRWCWWSCCCRRRWCCSAAAAVVALLNEARHSPRKQQQQHANKDKSNRTDRIGRGRAIVPSRPAWFIVVVPWAVWRVWQQVYHRGYAKHDWRARYAILFSASPLKFFFFLSPRD